MRRFCALSAVVLLGFGACAVGKEAKKDSGTAATVGGSPVEYDRQPVSGKMRAGKVAKKQKYSDHQNVAGRDEVSQSQSGTRERHCPAPSLRSLKKQLWEKPDDELRYLLDPPAGKSLPEPKMTPPASGTSVPPKQ